MIPADEKWMRLALEQAREAEVAGEVPVGAVLVKDGVIVAMGRNTPLATHDPSGHAEINALRSGAAMLGNHRLDGCELFVTLEPCAMCAGAMLHARLARVIYGARDPKTGAAGSVVDLFGLPQLNHRTRVTGDVLADACGNILQAFFKRRRVQARQASRPLRDDALRTPEERFAELMEQGSGSSWSMGRRLQRGWWMHWIGSSANAQNFSVLCLHGPGQWSYYFRNFLSIEKMNWIIPDLIGFGRSDKPKREAVHTLQWHCEVLLEWLTCIGMERLFLVHAESATPMAELMKAMAPDRILGKLVVPVSDAALDDATDAWRAPFPDRGHEAALRALGRAEEGDSGPSPGQALEVADAVMKLATGTMGYCRP